MKKIILAALVCIIIASGAFILKNSTTGNTVDSTPIETTVPATEAPTTPPETEAPTEPEVTEVVEESVPEETEAAEIETEQTETDVEDEEDRLLSDIALAEDVIIVVHELLPESMTEYPDDGQIVYAKHWINVRSEPTTKADIIGRIEEDERVFRFETSNGWSKIWYNNDIGYISNQYLGTAYIEDFDLYEDVDEIVYSGHDVNIRIAPSTYAPSIGKLAQGEAVRRIGIGKNGWSQIIYKNQLFFINSTYLSTDPNFKIPLEWFLSQEETEPSETNTGFEETEPIP